MKHVYLLLIGLFLSTHAFCSTSDSLPAGTKLKVYHVKRLPVAIVSILGLASDGIAVSRIKGKENITDAEIQSLNTSILTGFDRWALHQNIAQHTMYGKISDYGQAGVILLPGLLALNKTISKDWWDLMLMYAEGHTITFTFYNYSFLGPTFQNRFRPLTYYTEFSLDERESGNNRNSFYSGHTASTAYSTFFMAKVWCDYTHPNAGQKILAYTLASLPPIAMGYCRVKALDHFPSDCAVGFMLGAFMGVAIPEFHRFKTEHVTLSFITSPDETGVRINWNLTSHKVPRLNKQI